MKKILILFSVMVLVVGGVTVAQTTDSASLFLSGIVGEYVNIDVNATPAATNLLLGQGTSSPITVAEVVLSSNAAYEVSANSSNGFQFTNAYDNHPYQMQYNGSTVTQGGTVASGSFANGITHPVTVSYSAADANLPPGTYSDTVTFTIQAQ